MLKTYGAKTSDITSYEKKKKNILYTMYERAIFTQSSAKKRQKRKNIILNYASSSIMLHMAASLSHLSLLEVGMLFSC